MSTADRVVVHLLPVAIARGAQTYARALCDQLEGPEMHHRLVSIFQSDEGSDVDEDLGVARRSGWRGQLDPRAIRRLRRLWSEQRPDAIIAHGGEPLKYAALTVPPSIPLIYLKIGTSQPMLGSAPRRAAWSFLARRATAVVGVSQGMADEAKQLLGVRPERVWCIPNGRDPAPFTPAFHVDRVPIRLCFVGHLTRTKRPARFVELVRTLCEEGDQVEGVMAGGGPQADALAAPARNAGVDVLGVRNDVPDVLRGSDVFVFTSVEEGEGMPGVLIEAGLAGLPTVTTDVPGARDVVENGVTGFVVAVDDFASLVDATRQLVGEPELRAKMGSAARARCLERFTLQASAAKFDELIQSLLNS